MNIQLDKYDNRGFSRGRPAWIEIMWLIAQVLFIRSWIPGARHRRFLLQMFGAKIGVGVNIKPGLRVKFPWKLVVGDFTWIGEDVWIDNLAPVVVGANCCISQGAYLCTGSHDWSKPAFDLIAKPITIGDGSWLAARSVVAPGVTVEEGAVLGLGSVATKDLAPWTIHYGVPAKPLRPREVTTGSNP